MARTALQKAKRRIYEAANRETTRERERLYTETNRERINEREKINRENPVNRELKRIRQMAYLNANRGEVNNAQNNAYHKIKHEPQTQERLAGNRKKWKASNRGAVSAIEANRRAAKLQCRPPWFEADAVKAIYKIAALKRRNGKDIHVDHIIPLQGELVSGLHCRANLQILDSSENMSKGNTYEVS